RARLPPWAMRGAVNVVPGLDVISRPARRASDGLVILTGSNMSWATSAWESVGGCVANVAAAALANPNRGTVRSVPSLFWRLVRPAVWSRMAARLEAAEGRARALLKQGHPLSFLLTDSDLSSGWSITPLTMLALWNALQQKRPRRAVELGSGISTIITAYHA